jgi:hypothetical protein
MNKMKHRRFVFCAVLFWGVGLSWLQAQTMYVKEKNGTQTAYALNSVRKITFSGANANILKNDNSTKSFVLSGLQNLSFTNLTTNLANNSIPVSNASQKIYPNPFVDVLNIDLTGLEGEVTISILTLDGKIMQTQKAMTNSLSSFYLSYLPKGIYLCRYSTISETQTIKIIKQ